MRQSALITAALVLALAPLAPAQVRTTGPMVTRQTTAQRTARTPRAGEMVYDTTTGALYVGDGTTAGGVAPNLASSVGTGTGVVRPVSIQPTATGAGPLTFDGHVVTFSGTPDPTIGFGYNQNPNGTAIVAGEPGIRFQVEGNYNDGSGSNKVEAYLQYLSTDGTTTIRPFFYQLNRATNTLVAAQHLGPLQIYDSANTSTNWYQFNKNQFITNGSDNDTSIQINAPAGKNASFNLSRNAASATWQVAMNSDNRATITFGSFLAYCFNTPIGASGAAFAVGANDNSAVGLFAVGGSNAGVKALVARGKSGQTASLLELQDSAGTGIYYRWDKLGRPITANTTPTIAAGTGAGTGPTVSVSGTDVNGTITVTTGTGPAAAATVATITFSTAWGAAPKSVLITPANPATAAIWGTTTLPYVDSAGISTTKFDVSIGAGGLGASTTYKIYYDVKG
jgi:hypothetical protein